MKRNRRSSGCSVAMAPHKAEAPTLFERHNPTAVSTFR